jgi:hypothetical protein
VDWTITLSPMTTPSTDVDMGYLVAVATLRCHAVQRGGDRHREAAAAHLQAVRIRLTGQGRSRLARPVSGYCTVLEGRHPEGHRELHPAPATAPRPEPPSAPPPAVPG